MEVPKKVGRAATLGRAFPSLRGFFFRVDFVFLPLSFLRIIEPSDKNRARGGRRRVSPPAPSASTASAPPETLQVGQQRLEPRRELGGRVRRLQRQ